MTENYSINYFKVFIITYFIILKNIDNYFISQFSKTYAKLE